MLAATQPLFPEPGPEPIPRPEPGPRPSLNKEKQDGNPFRIVWTEEVAV
jgi:hypothetical protein